ncbi:MAG: helix-turn-helix domain-containing protein [bacterium]|nr:helix-turn-helix domain-containing protein [bacterium]
MRNRGRVRPFAEVMEAAIELPPARRRVLEAVEGMGEPATVAEVANSLGVHVSTVRTHLGALVSAGLVRTAERRQGERGRPARVYAPRAADPGRVHQSLISLVNTGLERVGAAESYEIGRAWGAEERRRELGGAADATGQQVVTILARLGFDPVWESESAVHIRSCPLGHRSPEEDQNLWELHRGLFAGLLGRSQDTFRFRPDDPRGGCTVDFGPWE